MKVELEPYNADWPKRFELEKVFLLDKIGGWLAGPLEHVGSTAVPGMLAKPVIDIMFAVTSLKDSFSAIDVLQANGYCYYPYKPEVMHWFCKPSPEYRTHHLHLVPYRSPLWDERIRFRDILLESPRIAHQYCELKKSLVAEMAFDREAYTLKKWPFIQQVLRDAASC